jgi:hypothetical protein
MNEDKEIRLINFKNPNLKYDEGDELQRDIM